LKTNTYSAQVFDAVMICNGHYHTPALPDIPGRETFEGRQIHSHDYRKPDGFQGSRVLVIGAGPSGLDMARELAGVADYVALSHRFSDEIASILCSKLLLKPVAVEIRPRSVVFSDGSEEKFDTILYCTGYKYSFPFLSQAAEVYVDDNCVTPLYKHVINIFHPTMAFIGLPFYVCAMQMFDLQVRFFLTFLTDRKTLPSREEMMVDTRRETEDRSQKGYKRKQFHMMGPIQLGYYEDLARIAGIEGIKPVLAKLHTESGVRFKKNLFNFRDFKYRIVNDENFVEA
jgi:dimethylaniline monooxygenase (N-oxide forming)